MEPNEQIQAVLALAPWAVPNMQPRQAIITLVPWAVPNMQDLLSQHQRTKGQVYFTWLIGLCLK
jgi:hypothetical protein